MTSSAVVPLIATTVPALLPRPVEPPDPSGSSSGPPPSSPEPDAWERAGGLSHVERRERTRTLLVAAAHAADDDARADLLARVVVLNHRVAQAVARRYRGRGIAEEDLEQAACEGLVKAAHHFDPALDHDFLSYAVPTVRGEVQRYFRDHGWAVRPPRRLQQLQWHLNRALAALAVELGREPTSAEVCARLRIDEAQLREVEASFGCFQPASLDHETAPDLADGTSPGRRGRVEDRHLAAVEERADLVPALRLLKERDRRIVVLRYYEDLTQQEIADELGITQMQVSRLLARIVRDLRRLLGAADQPADRPAGQPGG